MMDQEILSRGALATEVHQALAHLAIDLNSSVQALLAEGADLVLEKRGRLLRGPQAEARPESGRQ